MKKIKSIIAILATLSLLSGLVACSNPSGSSNGSQNENAELKNDDKENNNENKTDKDDPKDDDIKETEPEENLGRELTLTFEETETAAGIFYYAKDPELEGVKWYLRFKDDYVVLGANAVMNYDFYRGSYVKDDSSITISKTHRADPSAHGPWQESVKTNWKTGSIVDGKIILKFYTSELDYNKATEQTWFSEPKLERNSESSEQNQIDNSSESEEAGKPGNTDPDPGKNTETQDSGEYEIRILSQITGKVTASKTRANSGDKITLAATAADDCSFVEFLVFKGDSSFTKEDDLIKNPEDYEQIKVIDNYFVMPDLKKEYYSSVTVLAKFDVHDYFAGTSWYVYDKKVLEFKQNKKAEVQKGLYFEQYDVPSGEREYVVIKTKSGYSADLGDLVLNIEDKESENAEFKLTKYGSQSISKKKNVTNNPVERTREEDPFFNTTWEIANNAGGVDCQLVFYDDGTAQLINSGLSVQRSVYSVTKNGDSYIATCGKNSYTFTLSSLNATQGTLKWPIQKVEREVPMKGYQLAEVGIEKEIKSMTESGKIEIKGKIELDTVVRALNSLYEDKPNILVDLDMSQASFTKIDYNQFYYVRNLRSVIIPEGVTLIDSYAFQSCVNLESVTIPKSVMKIGMCAFSVCKKLASVVFVDNESTWNVGGEDVVMSDPANNVKVLTNPTLFSAITKKIVN